MTGGKMPAVIRLVSGTLGLICLTSCRLDPSVVTADKFRIDRIDWNVENGSAYDRSTVELGASNKVVLPEDAVVRRSGVPGKIQVLMEKTLGFGGHPGEPMSIHEARKEMGCATRVDGDVIMLATFGEWDSHIEGGATMKLIVIIPQEIDVERRKGLSGPKSAANSDGPAPTADGWSAIPSVADPERTARQ